MGGLALLGTMNNYKSIFKKSNSNILELSEKQTQEVKKILEIFEGSLTIEPVIREDKQRDFKSAYSFIMETYKPYHNIKPCVANVLINGLSDGWRENAFWVALECLRIFDFDMSKAGELAKLYFENSSKKNTRTLAHMRSKLKKAVRERSRYSKLTCNFLSRILPCVGCKEICYKIRGIGSKTKGGNSNMELLENQKALYLRRLLDNGYFQRLSKGSIKIYTFLLQKYFETNFNILFISHSEIAKGIGIKFYGHRAITLHLKELQRMNLIAYKPGNSKGTVMRNGKKHMIASEIKLIDITGRAESRADMLYREAFKN